MLGENIPFLMAIISGLVSVVKWIADSIAKAASRAAFYFSVIVPMVLRWVLTWRGFLLAVVVLCTTLFASVFSQVLSLTSHTFGIQDRLQYFFNQFKWMSFLLWDGPLNLKYAYGKIPSIFATWVSLSAFYFLVTKIRWYLWLANMKLKSGRL